MDNLSKTTSFPKLKKLSKSKLVNTEKIIRRNNRSIIKRLYSKDIKSIKQKDSLYWHKNKFDIKLEDKIKDLRQCKSKSSQVRLKKIKFPNNYEGVESNALTNLTKLQETMSLIINMPIRLIDEKKTHTEIKINQEEAFKIFSTEENNEKNNEKLIKTYKNNLAFINTRTKPIILNKYKVELIEINL